jgi:Mn-dependent DtxR family transcriptional regulator
VSLRLTPGQENYLEHIHRLSSAEGGGAVRIRDIALAAGVRMPSVTRAVARLAEAGLVVHQPYGRVEITRQGALAAEAVCRRDRCLHTLLVEVLDMDPERAEAEVCRLEHVLSNDVLTRLEVLVGHAQGAANRKWLAALQRKIRGRDGESGRSPRAQIGDTMLHK